MQKSSQKHGMEIVEGKEMCKSSKVVISLSFCNDSTTVILY